MSAKHFTATFEVERIPGHPREASTELKTLVFVDVHPAIYEACRPPSSFMLRPPALRHYAEIDGTQAEGIIRAFELTGRSGQIVTIDGLHAELQGEIATIKAQYRDQARIDEATRMLEALEAYAGSTRHEFGSGGPKF